VHLTNRCAHQTHPAKTTRAEQLAFHRRGVSILVIVPAGKVSNPVQSGPYSRDPATGLPVYRMSVATRGSSATTGLPPTTHLSHTAPLSYVVWDPCHLHQHIGHESRQACQKKHAFRRRGATIRGDGSGVEAGRSCQKEPPAGC